MTTKQFYQILLKSQGCTSGRMASLLGVSRSVTKKWNDGSEIGFENAQKVCIKLGTTLAAVLAKEAQSQSLDTCSNQSTNHK